MIPTDCEYSTNQWSYKPKIQTINKNNSNVKPQMAQDVFKRIMLISRGKNLNLNEKEMLLSAYTGCSLSYSVNTVEENTEEVDK